MSETGLRIYWDNFIDIDLLAHSDVSSQQAAFPVTNAYNAQRRGKVWRSSGFFKFTASNNQIVLRETSGGPDLIAQISIDEYSSITLACAAIKSALDAIGASTYTVTNSSATGFKFQIVSNGVGGSGVFHLMLTDSDFSAASILGFSTASDLTGASLTRLSDYLTISSEEFIEWDLGIESNPKGFALIGPRNSPLKLSPGGTYTLQGNHTSNWSMPAYETELTYNDNALYISDEEGLAEDYYRFWRVKIADQNPFGYVEVGAFMLGDFFAPVRGRAQYGLDIDLVDHTQTLFSEGGQSYADIKPKTANYSISWRGLKKEAVEEIENQFAVYGTGIPFFVGLDTVPAFSSSSQRRLLFCKFAQEPRFTLISPNNFECSMLLREEL